MSVFSIGPQYNVPNLEITDLGNVVIGPGGSTNVNIFVKNGTLSNVSGHSEWTPSEDTEIGCTITGTPGASGGIPNFDWHLATTFPAELYVTVDDGTGNPSQIIVLVRYDYQVGDGG